MKILPVEPASPPRGEVLRRAKALRPPLAPLLAGARARGVADGLEWMGVAAVLLDDRGEALHVNAGAQACLGQGLYVEDGRLRASDVAADAALAAGIRQLVETGVAGAVDIPAPADSGRAAIRVRIEGLDTVGDDPYQLLRGVAVLEFASEGATASLTQRH